MPFIKDGALGLVVFLFAHTIHWLTGQSCASGVQLLLPAVCNFLRLPLELRLIIYGHLLSEWPFACFTGTMPVWDGDPEHRRWPAILRTSHQIYAEASAVLYAEVTGVLLAGDILCLENKITSGFPAPRLQLWMHHPFRDAIGHYYIRFGQRVSNALRAKQLALQARFGIRLNKCPVKTCTLQPILYDSPLMNGLLEPHVFTRFRNLYFQLHFDLEMIACPYRIDDDLKVRTIARDPFTSFLRGCIIFKNLVRPVRLLPHVRNLNVSIEMENAPRLLVECDFDSFLPDDWYEIYFAVHSKACEQLIDSGVLDTFLRLSNVQEFDLVFVRTGINRTQYKKVEDLKRVIEQQGASKLAPKSNAFHDKHAKAVKGFMAMMM